MADSINNIAGTQANLAAVRRSAIEEQLSRAIQRAQKHYLEAPKKPIKEPSTGPSHLGKKIDVRV